MQSNDACQSISKECPVGSLVEDFVFGPLLRGRHQDDLESHTIPAKDRSIEERVIPHAGPDTSW